MRLKLALLLVVVGLGASVPAMAQENGLTQALGELLRGETPDGQPARRVPFGRAEMQLSFAPLVEQTSPAVVNVYATTQQQARSPFMGDPFFEQFFGRQMPPRVQSSLGSGVLVDRSGIVVTNTHVIADADEVKVALPDGREFDSRVLLQDEALDLAVLKIEGNGDFPVIAIGDSEALAIGDLVLAIGNPFGVGQTTTSGIVSALARSHVGISDFGFFIQTDAAINPGNSGGALINMAGELVGINTAIFSKSGGSIGIGFAIPSNMVRVFVDAAMAGKEQFERPYIGATFESVTADIAEALGMERPYGALVTDVEADGPAARAGLQPGSVVTAFDGSRIEHPDALGYRLATETIGSTVTLTVLQQGRATDIALALVAPPEGTGRVTLGGDGPFAGATVQDISPALAQRMRLATSRKGVAVVGVDGASPAGSLGLRPGDIVRELNGVAITRSSELKRVAEMPSRMWRFTIERNGRLIQQMLRF
jgi:Do/DeqQ family serine protease